MSQIQEEQVLTLKEVIDVVPASCRQRSTSKGLVLVGRDLLLYALVLTGLVLSPAWWVTLPLLLLAGLTVAALFVLGHDAAHGVLTDDNRLNSVLGHALLVPSFHIYEAWVLGHNRIHHGHTVRQGMDFVWHPATVEQYRGMGSLARLRHRVEWSALGPLPYYLREVWWNKMIRYREPPAKWVAAIRRDRIMLYLALLVAATGAGFLGGLGSGDVLGAAWMIAKLLVIPFLLFTFLIGWTVYVHHISPDIRWYTRREWTKVQGQLDGTTILRIPRVLNLFFHSIFVHTPHHVDMRIPCYHLSEAAESIREAFPDRTIDRKLRIREFVAGTRICKLYDFEAGHWLPYSAAE
jgi:omega-6 fatty acid desaturase (delta-12 desaturase)